MDIVSERLGNLGFEQLLAMFLLEQVVNRPDVKALLPIYRPRKLLIRYANPVCRHDAQRKCQFLC